MSFQTKRLHLVTATLSLCSVSNIGHCSAYASKSKHTGFDAAPLRRRSGNHGIVLTRRAITITMKEKNNGYA